MEVKKMTNLNRRKDEMISIIQIPKIIFEKIKRKSKQQKLDTVILDGKGYPIKLLTAKNDKFFGLMALCKSNLGYGLCYTLKLWGIFPNPANVFDEDPLFKISSGPKRTGEWFKGKGHHFKEVCEVNFSSKYYSLMHPTIKFIPEMLKEALELAPKADAREFWEVEKYPSMKFS